MSRIAIGVAAAAVALVTSGARAADLQVVSVNPPRNLAAAATTAISITFDRAVYPCQIKPIDIHHERSKQRRAADNYDFRDVAGRFKGFLDRVHDHCTRGLILRVVGDDNVQPARQWPEARR